MSKKTISQYTTFLSRGITPKYIEKNGILIINQKCIRNNKIDLSVARRHDFRNKNIAKDKILKKYDVLVNSTGIGTLGRVAQYLGNERITVDSHVTIVRPNIDLINPLYFGFIMRLNQSKIESMAEGSTGQTELSRVALGNLEVEVIDDIDIQTEIADILHNLDLKIWNNEMVNSSVEYIALSFFKSWFIDFDPVRAKAQAKASGGDLQHAILQAISGKTQQELEQLSPKSLKKLADTAELFPDKLIETDNGDIPLGWKFGSIGELYSAKGGFAFKSKEFGDEGYPVVKIKNISADGSVDLKNTQFISSNSKSLKSDYELSDGEVVMAMTGATVGKVGCVVKYSDDKVYLNQRVAVFKSKRNSSISWYPYIFFRQHDKCNNIVGLAQGSAQPNISSNGIESVTTVIPPSYILVHFDKIINPLYLLWISNSKQNEALIEFRDNLLPKLLSGAIKIKD